MGPDSSPAREELELELVREVVLARRRMESLIRAALVLGAELMEHSGAATAERAARIMDHFAVDEDEVIRDPRAALRADLARDSEHERRFGRRRADSVESEQDRRRRRQSALLLEVRADLLALLRRCHQVRLERAALSDEIAKGLCEATDKLVLGADMATYDAWRRGLLLKLVEEPTPHGPPRVLATVDAGPGRAPLTVDWDSCERRLALVARLARAGLSPLVICDRLLADLSMSSPLRHSMR
ncbi:hypothetical protein D5S18_25555 [Nocardia panacis]|uniref:Uncharacterized protein n=1 Tax=Nocardia panacis TaxID=2340916 RepID=A0A3A4K915_9NOCA|nr:hypothetical protein [Nocardia panacis]RJO71276.1 hypothetical protein D5S18_25555 [Nocardia panacis]